MYLKMFSFFFFLISVKIILTRILITEMFNISKNINLISEIRLSKKNNDIYSEEVPAVYIDEKKIRHPIFL
jgi:hypothetical protein